MNRSLLLAAACALALATSCATSTSSPTSLAEFSIMDLPLVNVKGCLQQRLHFGL